MLMGSLEEERRCLNGFDSFSSVVAGGLRSRPRQHLVSRLLPGWLHRAGNTDGPEAGFLRGEKEPGFPLGRAVLGRAGR